MKKRPPQHMISKNKIKLIHALEQKKYRKAENLFVAEGHKTVEDLLPVFGCSFLAATTEWLNRHPLETNRLNEQGTEVAEVNEDELRKASLLKTPQDVLALFRIPQETVFHADLTGTDLALVLDGVQDPGNLGTILRIADWFGIKHIVCSPDTADAYNPKTVQATMGALARVQIHYMQLNNFFNSLKPDIPVYGTFLDGENIYKEPLKPHGIIVMGNEGKGISTEVERYINKKLLIPSFPENGNCVESLNVAVATAIVCAEFRRRSTKSE